MKRLLSSVRLALLSTALLGATLLPAVVSPTTATAEDELTGVSPLFTEYNTYI